MSGSSGEYGTSSYESNESDPVQSWIVGQAGAKKATLQGKPALFSTASGIEDEKLQMRNILSSKTYISTKPQATADEPHHMSQPDDSPMLKMIQQLQAANNDLQKKIKDLTEKQKRVDQQQKTLLEDQLTVTRLSLLMRSSFVSHGQHTSFPQSLINAEEREEIQDILSSEIERPNFQIFPRTSEGHLMEEYPDVVNRLRNLYGESPTVVIATKSLRDMLDGEAGSNATPQSLLFDVCTFSPLKPVLILTVASDCEMSDCEKTNKLLAYNSDLTRRIVQSVSSKTNHNFSAVSGVVEVSLFQTCDKFNEKVHQLQQDAVVMFQPPALVMTQRKCLEIIQPIFDLLPIAVAGDPLQTIVAVKQEEYDAATSDRDYRAMLERIKQLEESQERMQTERAEHKREKDELVWQYDQVVEKFQKVEQGSLSDTRLKLLMRPRSSSFETVTSGYCSTEADIPWRQDYTTAIETRLGPEKDQQSQFPATLINLQEGTKIRAILSSGQEQPNFHIFPCTVAEHLNQRYPNIVSRLRELPRRGTAVGILLSMIDGETRAKPTLKTVLFDICIFFPSEPVLVLTVTSEFEKTYNVDDYNSELTRGVVQFVSSRTHYNFSAVYGVVEASLCLSREKFIEKIQQLHRDANRMSQPDYLFMTPRKCLDIIQHVLQLTPDDLANIFQQATAEIKQEDESAISQDDFAMMMERIKQLEQAQEEHQRRKETTVKNDPGHVMEKPENVQQDYVTVGKKPKGQPNLTTQAIQIGDLELVKYNRDIALHQACNEGKLNVVKYILSDGVSNINCRGERGRTPVIVAARKGQVAIVDFLVRKRCDLSAVDDFRNNVLHAACKSGNISIVRKLVITKKCNIDCKGHAGRTAVMRTAYYGHKVVFRFLVDRECNLSVVDDDKNTILHVACMRGHIDLVEYILEHNIVDVEKRGFMGRTPVMTAVFWGHKDVFDFLVSCGSDLTVVDDQKNNILHVACYGGNSDIVEYILLQDIVNIERRGFVKRTPLLVAAYCGDEGVFGLLTNHGSDLTALDEEKNTILHLACCGGNVDIVNYILSQNTVEIESRDTKGRTALMDAVKKGRITVLDCLVSKGSNRITIDDGNNTILHVACAGGHLDMVEYLLTQPAIQGMKKMKNKKGQTPVKMAESWGHKEVVSFLYKMLH